MLPRHHPLQCSRKIVSVSRTRTRSVNTCESKKVLQPKPKFFLASDSSLFSSLHIPTTSYTNANDAYEHLWQRMFIGWHWYQQVCKCSNTEMDFTVSPALFQQGYFCTCLRDLQTCLEVIRAPVRWGNANPTICTKTIGIIFCFQRWSEKK